MHQKEIPSIDHSCFKFFCFPLNTDYLSYLHNKFQVISTYDINVGQQILSSWYCLLWDNRHTHRPTHKNVIFRFREPQNISIQQNFCFENFTSKQHFLPYMGKSKAELNRCCLQASTNRGKSIVSSELFYSHHCRWGKVALLTL